MKRSLYVSIIAVFSLSALFFAQSALAQIETKLTPLSSLIINQVVSDPADPTQLAYVELFDGGVGSTDLSGLLLIFVSPDKETFAAYDLDGFATNENGIFVIGLATLSPPPDLPLSEPLSLLQVNGATLLAADTVDARNDSIIVVDMLTFGADTDDADSLKPSSPAAPPLPAMAAASAPAADTAPAPRGDTGACGDAASRIHEVQGDGTASPMLGETVLLEALVTAAFQDTRRGLRGFFLQEETTEFDANPATSEGIFVFESAFAVRAGDLVRVKGRVHEFNGLTELKSLSGIQICSRDNESTPISVTLPEVVEGDLEQHEGMFVRIASPMTVAQTYFLGRYGQLTLAAGARPYQPTHLFPPGSAEAQAVADENARRLLVLDDGQDIRALGDNPNPVPYLGAPPPAVLRAGDTVTNLVGVLDFGRINSAPGAAVGLGYRLQPTEPPVFTPANLRIDTPPAVGGDLKVASFNVLNYFNGDGSGGGFPTARGAATPAEFERQRVKIIAAIRALDADIVGLMEIENDGYGAESAIQNLVDGLNADVASSQTYAFVDPLLDQLGGDAIQVGILYRPASVTPVGVAATLDTGAFDQDLPDGGMSRQPLAQTFATADGERFTVVVNHFKSKRPSASATGGNIDARDGAGSWNERRTEAAQDLADWLASDPTASGDPDFLIIGDLNAYAKETPISAIEAAGYVNLLERFNGSDAYSFVFDGQAGYLDHALASASLISQTTGAADWHINADEPPVIGYETAFNPPGYYDESPFRASDHDPVLIGFALAPLAPITVTPVITEPTTITPTTPITVTPVITEPTIITPTTPITVTPVITAPTTITPTTPITVTPVVTEPTTVLTPTAPITTTPVVTEPLTAAPGAGFEYVVVPGDNLTRLAQRFGVTLRELASANGLTVSSYLYVGQRLRIPDGATPVVCAEEYVVQRGDNLSTIGRRYGIGYGRLATVNSIANPNLIRVGQRLCIPAGSP